MNIDEAIYRDQQVKRAHSHEMRAERLRNRGTFLAKRLAMKSYSRAAVHYDLAGFRALASLCRAARSVLHSHTA